ncbi:MAG: hypothetical protein LCH93_28920 [Proteobacteria bacterium]|nr:hypothetical protein [Pseudomonadota bacterium]
MGEVFGRAAWKVLAGVVGASLVTFSATAQSQGEPPGRVGRLAFVDGTVSFYDDEQSGWTKAIVNTPLTTGDALWTEPNARSEVSLAGTRIRMDGSTELDMTQIDDAQVRLQLAQGRVDVKSFAMDAAQPYEIVTPRGTITLQQQGDYYVEAGSTQDPTRLGVRSGAAQIQGLNGQTLAVRAGEVGEVFGDGSALQLRTVQAAPPAPAASWAARDRQVIYDQQPQYVPAGMTGYEDLNAYGNWINDGSYGQVWVPRSTPAGWAPYRTGHWSYVKPWGWTWIDEQPWGFAPYHYGRWANSNNRWVWVPPQREQRPVYAPALVAFVGGLELAAQLGNQGRNTGPVGWFPLGPREVYVPPYTTNRDYYQRINRAAMIQDRDLNDRWERAQRREAYIAGQNSVLANQRFATVVPSQAFVRSQPVQRAALNVAADKIAKAAVAPVAAPPAPTASVAAVADVKSDAKVATKPGDVKAPADAKARTDVAVAKTAVADMPTLAKPATTDQQKKAAAPGPKIASTDTKAGADAKAKTAESPDVKTAKPATPPLQPRQGAAPPAPKETSKAAPEQARQEPGKPAANQPKEAAPAPPKPALTSPAPSPAKRDEAKPIEPKQAAPAPEKPNAPQSRPDSRQDERKQAAPDQQKPNAAPQPKQDEPKQATPAPKPAATPAQRQEEPRQAAPQPAPKPEAAPRQEAPRQAAPQPRAEPPQQQAQPPRPQPQQQAPKDKETRAPAPQQQPQQQIAQPPKAEQPQRGNNGGGNKKDKD